VSLRAEAYDLARRAFWALPPAFRSRLNGLRHFAVRHFRSEASRSGSTRPGDLSWAEFQSSLLEARGTDRPVIVFEPTVHWNVPLFQRPQQMALALARRGWLVLYRTTGDALVGFRKVTNGLWLANAPEVSEIEGVLWSFYSTGSLATPESLRDRRQRQGRVVYEYVDAIDPSISGGDREAARLLRLRDAAFAGIADRVVVTARQLYEEALGATSVAVAYIPNGVEPEHYRGIRESQPLPEVLRAFCARYGTIAGYFGAIAPWLDYQTLGRLSADRPDVGFVFIGVDYDGSAARLPRADNVLYLGPVDYAVLPAYARVFDVGLIPFTPGPLARSTSPLKLFEYFALERPVVVTADMPECLAFDGVFHGEGPNAVAALDRALAVRDDPALRERLRKQADDHSWDRRAEAYAAFVTG
jgi:glycosyltransferase involved in cell wall biosynthesis